MRTRHRPAHYHPAVQGQRMTTEELKNLDERVYGQLKRSIELNARMVTRLQKYARQVQEHGCDSQLAAKDLIDISHDKDPWI